MDSNETHLLVRYQLFNRQHTKPAALRSATVVLKDTSAALFLYLFFPASVWRTACFLLVQMISLESLQSWVTEPECRQEAQRVLYKAMCLKPGEVESENSPLQFNNIGKEWMGSSIINCALQKRLCHISMLSFNSVVSSLGVCVCMHCNERKYNLGVHQNEVW